MRFLFNSVRNMLFLMMMGGMMSCSGGGDDNSGGGTSGDDDKKEEAKDTTFAKGADVSWVTQMEADGIKFYNSSNQETECMKLLRDQCSVNSIRLRVWVNPTDGYNNADDVVKKAVRAKNLGMRVMIDFHMSDTWADPGNQKTPAAWSTTDLATLKQQEAAHVKDVLTKLKNNGVTPQWVQIGNETADGMLYPLGKISTSTTTAKNFAELVNAGYDAVKSVFANALVIVHVDSGDKDQNGTSVYGRYRVPYVFGSLEQNGGKYDMIGISFYPEAASWQASAQSLVTNMKSWATTYGKPVMICEVGMQCEQGAVCKQMITYIRKNADSNLKGIFYWEPEAPKGYNGGYDKGAFLNGKPTVALDAFKD